MAAEFKSSRPRTARNAAFTSASICTPTLCPMSRSAAREVSERTTKELTASAPSAMKTKVVTPPDKIVLTVCAKKCCSCSWTVPSLVLMLYVSVVSVCWGCGLAASLGKKRVPYCEERPVAAHCRRDHGAAVTTPSARRSVITASCAATAPVLEGLSVELHFRGRCSRGALVAGEEPFFARKVDCCQRQQRAQHVRVRVHGLGEHRLLEGPRVRCGFGGELGKPRVPHCQERPGATHSMRDQALCCSSGCLGVSSALCTCERAGTSY